MISPNVDTGSFSSWWSRSLKEVDKLLEKGINSLILLVALELRKQRNDVVFNSATPDVNKVEW